MEAGSQGSEEGCEGRRVTDRAPGLVNTPPTLMPLRLTAWGLGAAAIALLHNRVWATPNLAFFSTIAKDLGTNPFAGSAVEGDYLLTNLLGPAVARALGQTDPAAYARLHLLAFVALTSLAVALAARRFGYPVARALVVLLAAAPATTVVMQWLGQPDAFTIPLALLLVIVASTPARIVVAILLGLAHAEQGAGIALVAALVAVLIDRLDGGPNEYVPVPLRPESLDDPLLAARAAAAPQRARLKRLTGMVMAPVIGVAIGVIAVRIYLLVNNITVSKPRTSFLSLGFDGFVDHHLRSPLWLIYSLWGPLWLVIVALAIVARRQSRSAARTGEHAELGDARDADTSLISLPTALVVLAVGAAAGLVPMVITLDQTRVYSMVTGPLLVGAAVLIGRYLWTGEHTVPPIAIAGGAVALAVVPGMFSAGEAYFSTALPPSEAARFLIDGDIPDGKDLTGFLLEPFAFEIPDTD